MLSALPPMTSCWCGLELCRRRKAARSGAPLQGVISPKGRSRRRPARDAVADLAIVLDRICCALFPVRVGRASIFLCDLVVVRDRRQRRGWNDRSSCRSEFSVAVGGSAGPCPDSACFRGSGTFRVTGAEHIPRRGAILMFNHSSPVDALVLAAVLPGEPAYFAKKGICGSDFHGNDVAPPRRSVDRTLRSGRKPRRHHHGDRCRKPRSGAGDFSEGTFTHRSGLLGSFLGGFKIASEARLPIVPAPFVARGRCCEAINGCRERRLSAWSSVSRSTFRQRLRLRARGCAIRSGAPY